MRAFVGSLYGRLALAIAPPPLFACARKEDMGEKFPRRLIALRHVATIGQTFFVDHPWPGLLVLVSVAAAAPKLAVAGLLASALARCVAAACSAPEGLRQSGQIELNGWFVGLACATFYPIGPALATALALGAGLTAVVAIVLDRVLRTWALPLVIAPYVPAFWIVWSALAGLPWAATSMTTTPGLAPVSSPGLLVLVAGLRGLGQIFFVPNAAVGLCVAVAASMRDGRVGPFMVLASTASVALGHFVGTPAWQVDQGLAGFTPALIVAGAMTGFIGGGVGVVLVTIVASPFLEAAAVRVAGALSLPALSLTYVAIVWTVALVRPVRRDACSAESTSQDSPRNFARAVRD